MELSRRTMVRVIGAGGLAAGAGALGLSQCDRMPAEAIAAWGGPGAEEKELRRRALSYALLAPNPHNLQSWIADLREPGAITLYTDTKRLLPATDPFARQIMVGCGAFLELLVMAIAEQGRRPVVSLFPAGEWSEGQVGQTPFARVDIAGTTNVMRDPLFAFATKRHTNRNPYDSQAMTAEEAAAIASVCESQGLHFGWSADDTLTTRLKDIAWRAWGVEVGKDATYYESVNVYRVTARKIAANRDGLPFHGPVMWWLNALGLFSRERAMTGDPFLRDQALNFSEAAIRMTPSFAWIVSASNDRAAQIAAGRSYVRAQLKATELGLSFGPLSQALQEFPEMAPLMAEMRGALGIPEGETLQMFVRAGRAAAAEPSPRRALDDICRV